MNRKILGLAGLFVAIALFAVPSGKANAATSAELQLQIDALLAQLAQLQGGGSACFTFTRDLYEGVSGNDVVQLQTYLKSTGHFPVTVNSTGFYGPITVAAVAAWQTQNGVMPAAGYFGPISRAKYNSLCSMTPGPTPTPGDDDDDDDFDSGDGEEASLEDFDAKSGDDTSAQEGQEGAEVLEFEFDVEGSDVEVQRVEVNFNWDGTASGEEDPWKAFDAATLLFDGEEVADADLSDEDNWDEEVSNDEWSFRFNGIDAVVKDGETGEFIVALDVANSVDGSSTGTNNEWYVSIDNSGVRALDEAGIDQYTGESGDDVLVNIEEAGNEDELSVTESDNSPEATVFEGDTSETSDWLTVAILEASADGDLQLNDIMFDVAAANGSDTYAGLVNDLQLVIGGEEYSDFSVVNSTGATGTVTFDLDDEDIVIDDGEEIEIEIQVELKGSTGNWDEGDNLVVNASSAAIDLWDVEGVDSGEDLGTSQLSGSFEGEIHTVRTAGISLALGDTTAVAPVGENEASAEYTIEFDVTAFGQDWYIKKTTARDASGDVDDGVNFVLETSGGTEYSTTTITVTSDLEGDSSSDTTTHYKVPEGATRTFTLSVGLDNSGASTEGQGFYRVHITGVAFDADGSGAAADYVLTTGLEDFHTDTEEVDDANI